MVRKIWNKKISKVTFDKNNLRIWYILRSVTKFFYWYVDSYHMKHVFYFLQVTKFRKTSMLMKSLIDFQWFSLLFQIKQWREGMLYDITDNYYIRLPGIKILRHMQAGIQQICADCFCRVRYRPNSIGSSRVVNYFGESFFTIITFRTSRTK